MMRQLIFKTGAQDLLEKDIQSFTLPPAVHVALSQPERTLLQYALKKKRILDLNI